MTTFSEQLTQLMANEYSSCNGQMTTISGQWT